MKFNITLLILLSILFQNCEKEKIILNPKNELEKFSKVKEQTFDLDTLSFSEIKGKNGTLIYFNKNDFNVEKESKVKVILKEYFELKDLIFNNINTITDKNELLESSGVIYLEFQSNGKKINIKKNKFIEIKLPKEQLKESLVFYAKIDNFKQVKWKKENIEYTKIINKVNFGGGITLEREYIFPSDSLSFYNEKWKKEMEDYQDYINRINKMNNYATRLISDKYNKMSLINFDTFIKSGIKLIDFQVDFKDKSIEQLTFYVLYKNRKAFVSLYKTIDDLNFNKIPFIENETSLLVIGKKNEKLLFDIINLKQNSTEKFKIHWKKYDENQIEILLKK